MPRSRPAWSVAQRSPRSSCCPRATARGLCRGGRPSTPPSPTSPRRSRSRRSRRARRRAVRRPASAEVPPTTSTCTTRTAPSPTPSRSPAGSTRWPSARRRSSARCATALREAQRGRSASGQSLNAPVPAGAARRQARPRRDRHRPASVSLVTAPGLAVAERSLGDAARPAAPLVVGAGGMSALAATTAAAPGVASLTIVNRTADRAVRLAERTGATRPTARRAGRVARRVPTSSSPAPGLGTSSRGGPRPQATPSCARGRPQVFVDLALPHDVAPARWPSLPRRHARRPQPLGAQLLEAGRPHRGACGRRPRHRRGRRLPHAARMQKSVAPTVAALRAHAADVVAAELARLDQRLPHLDEQTRAEVAPRRAPRRREAAPHPDRAGQGAGDRGQRRRLRRSPAPALRPRARATSPTSSAPPRDRRYAMTALRDRPLAGHPPQRARHDPVALGRRPAARASATRSSSSRSRPRATVHGDAAPTIGGTGVFVAASATRAARRPRSTSPCTRSRTCPPRPTPPRRRGHPAARGPARRPGRPRRAHPR